MSQPPQYPQSGDQPWNNDPAQGNPGQFPETPGTTPDQYQQTPGNYDTDPGQYQPSQPAGQAGYDTHGGTAPQQPDYAAAFAEEPKKSGSIKRILSGIVTLVLVAAGGYFIWQRFASDAALEVGKCVIVTGTASNADHKEVKCDDASAFSYVVAKVANTDGSCSDETFLQYSLKGRSGKTTKLVCLVPQFTPDTCYKENITGLMMFTATPCSSADFKVTKVEATSNATCATEEKPLSLTEPARTYCLAAVK